MRNMVKFGFIASVLLLISCSSDFPPAPEMEFCKFILDDEDETTVCKSIHVFSKSDCVNVNGEIVNTCDKEPETGTD